MKTWQEFDIPADEYGMGHKYVMCPVCSPLRKKQKLKTLGITYDNSNSWACTHCGFSGSLYKGILTAGDPYQYTKGQMKGRSLSKEYNKPKFESLEEEYPAPFLDYFKSRGIGVESLRKNQIQFGKTKFSSREDSEEAIRCIKFPFIKDGEVVNIKYKGFHEKVFKQSYNCEKVVYGFDDIQGKKIIVMCEGEIDKVSIDIILTNSEHGCCSVPDGAPAPNTKDYTVKFDFLESIEDTLNNAEKVILAVDDDLAGEKLLEELSRRIGREKCWIIKYPEGCKDPNEILVKHGPEVLLETISGAKRYPITGIFTVQDFEDKIDSMYLNGVTPGLELPWESTKDLFRVSMKEFTTVTGVPQSGKSELIDCFAMHFAKEHQIRVGIFSPEHPTEIHIMRLAEKMINKPIKINYIKGPVEDVDYMTKEEFFEAKRFINKYFFWLKPDNRERMTLENLHDKKKSLIMRYGVQMFIDDPFNKMDHARPHHMSETEYISEFLDKYAIFNEDYNTHSFLVAHPTKLKKVKKKVGPKFKDEIEVYPVANAYDISGSSHWWNKSMNILSVYRSGMNMGTEAGKNEPTELYTQKVKFKWNGKLDVAKLYFNSLTGNYTDGIQASRLSKSQDGSDVAF